MINLRGLRLDLTSIDGYENYEIEENGSTYRNLVLHLKSGKELILYDSNCACEKILDTQLLPQMNLKEYSEIGNWELQETR